jgi:glc operon protein GlcG
MEERCRIVNGFDRKFFATALLGVFATTACLWPSAAANRQASSSDLPTKKYLDLASIKTMVAGAEAEARRRNVEVTICVVDESGNLLFLEKADAASGNTVQFAEKKARQAALYRSSSKDAADSVKKGSVEFLTFPDFFPVQGGLPIRVDGLTIGAMAASGAQSEVDEAIVQAGIDARFKK